MVERRLHLTPDRIEGAGLPCAKALIHDMPYGDSLHRPFRSRLTVYEDGRPLGPGHSLHEEIHGRGRGRFSHWGRTLFFAASDNSDPATNNRRYELVWTDVQQPFTVGEGQRVRRVTDSIIGGAAADLAEINALCLMDEPLKRGHVFRALADAFYVVGDNALADEQMVRAWRQGVRDRDVQNQALRWALRQGDDERVRWILHGAARLAAEQGDAAWITDLILRHHEWLGDLYARTARSFHQDEMLIEPLSQVFARHRPHMPARGGDARLRVGYVLAGDACPNFSSLPEIVIDMALGHDPSAVTARVISLNHPRDVAANPFFPPLRQRLEQARLALDVLPASDFAGLCDTAAAIAAMDLDVLVFGNATHWNLLLAALHPARRVAGVGLGEAELFSSVVFDTTFHLSFGPARDGCGHSTFLRAGNLPESRFRDTEPAATRAELGLPDEAVVLLSCARPVKFLESRYWQVMLRVLAQEPTARLVLIGLSVEQMEALPDVAAAAPELRARLHPLGWRDHAHRLIAVADIFIDTFPNGGGLSAFEAMNLGIPVVAVRESPLTLFDERHWSPVPEYMDNLAAPPLDDDAIVKAILDLIGSPEERAELGRRGQVEVVKMADRRQSSATLAAAYADLLRGVSPSGPARPD